LAGVYAISRVPDKGYPWERLLYRVSANSSSMCETKDQLAISDAIAEALEIRSKKLMVPV
jgi:hypothetical protein